MKNKAKIEEYLKSHQFDYKWNDEKKYLVIIKFKCWKVPYFELENNILIDIDIESFFEEFIKTNLGFAIIYQKDKDIYHYYEDI